MRRHSLMAFVPAFGVLGLQSLRIAVLTMPEKETDPQQPLTKNNHQHHFMEEEMSNSTTKFPLLVELTVRDGEKKKNGETDSSYSYSCPRNYLRLQNDTHIPESHSIEHRNIPKIIHQTSKSRCLTRSFRSATKKWASTLYGWSYYLHDDVAMERLLIETEFPEFPLLQTVAKHCLLSGTIKADIWRYLVLYVYGGIYADLDTVPTNKFTTDTIEAHYDGFFVVDDQNHMLSQYFMAIAPHHPLMYYAVQHSIANILYAEDTGNLNAAHVTGSSALHQAFIEFRKDAGVIVDPLLPKVQEGGGGGVTIGKKPIVGSGTFVGSHNRSITVVGDDGTNNNENEYIQRSMLKEGRKKHQYIMMNMTHFDAYLHPDKRSNSTCFSALLHASK